MTQRVNPTVLANTAVTAGIYGGSTKIPFFTVDDQGRLTNAGNTNPSVANTQITGVITATQVANTANYAINISGTAGAAGLASSVPVGGITGTQYSYIGTTRPGPTRLYRDDDNSAFNIRTFYNNTTTRWILHGYNGDTVHNGVEVAYANTAGSAPASDVYTWAKQSTKPSYTKSEISLGNVDNTADADKRVNYANTANVANTATYSLGIGQTWQDVTGSRAYNTTYTNSTGKPIFVMVGTTDNGSGCYIQPTVGGVTLPYQYDHNNGAAAASFIVPNNTTYSVTGSSSLARWCELR